MEKFNRSRPCLSHGYAQHSLLGTSLVLLGKLPQFLELSLCFWCCVSRPKLPNLMCTSTTIIWYMLPAVLTGTHTRVYINEYTLHCPLHICIAMAEFSLSLYTVGVWKQPVFFLKMDQFDFTSASALSLTLPHIYYHQVDVWANVCIVCTSYHVHVKPS